MYLTNLTKATPELESLKDPLNKAKAILSDCYYSGGKIMTCGNGGSAADSEHIVGELMKGFLLKRKITPEKQKEKLIRDCPAEIMDNLQMAIPAISLVSGVALPTAFANDVNPEYIFAQQVWAIGKPEDVLIAISTSGNSANIIAACHVAKALGIKIIGLTGNKANKLSALADVFIAAPSSDTPKIQEYHLSIYHALCAQLEKDIFGNFENIKD